MKHVDLTSTILLVVLSGISLFLLASCSKEQPRSVDEFIADQRLLEATMVRCARDRLELKYTAECINAREAVDRLAARDQAKSRAEMEAESARKRDALRRSQRAAEDARARAEEAERLQREAEYLGQFEPAPGMQDTTVPAPRSAEPATSSRDTAAADAGNDPATLEQIREELRRDEPTP